MFNKSDRTLRDIDSLLFFARRTRKEKESYMYVSQAKSTVTK